MKKINILTISMVLSILFLLLIVKIAQDGSYFYHLCFNSNLCEYGFAFIAYFSLIGPATLIQSILARYLGNEEIQLKWKNAFRNFVIGYIALVVLLPRYIGDAFLGFDKRLILLAYSTLFLVVTLITTSIRIYSAKKEN